MKYLLTILMILATATAAIHAHTSVIVAPHWVGLSPGDSITLDYLVGMDKKKFTGKPLKDFLESREAKGYQEIKFRHGPGGMLEGIRIKYSSNLYLHVYVREFEHLQPLNEQKNWDLEELKKEKVDEIRVVYVMHEGK